MWQKMADFLFMALWVILDQEGNIMTCGVHYGPLHDTFIKRTIRQWEMGTRMKIYYSLMKNFKSKQVTAHGHCTDRDMNDQQQITQYINSSINKVL